MSKKLEFKIDPKIFNDLQKIRNNLPDEATGEHKKDAAEAYDSPAGLALLGVKEGILDTVVNLAMSGGCWDAPNVNHKDFDTGFRKMIEADRMVVGMALVRHPDWSSDDWRGHEEGDYTNEAKIPTHLKYEIRHLSHSFADIVKTAWIVLQNDYFRIYKPYKDEEGRLKITEISINDVFDEEAKKVAIVKDKLTFMANTKEKRAAKKHEMECAKQFEIAQEIEREETRISRQQKKNKEINKKIKEGTESVIDAGGGLSYVKGKDGKYILWQTGR
jgi:hypothetical protein